MEGTFHYSFHNSPPLSPVLSQINFAHDIPFYSFKVHFNIILSSLSNIGELSCTITISPTYLLTPWSRVLLEKLTGFAASQEIPRIYGTRKFITVLPRARHLSLSWARSIQSPQPLPTSWRSILILSSHLRLGLPIGLVPSDFPTKTLCTPLPSPIRATCPAHLILLDFTTRTILGKEYRSVSSLCNFLHSPVISSLLGPTLSSAPYSQTPSAYVHTQRVQMGPSGFR
jgi:hypothetical protein